MKLLSWNLQWCRGVDGRVDPARIARTVHALDAGGIDVLCFQEVARGFDTLAGSAGEDQFAALAAAFAGYAAFEAVAVDHPGTADGRRRQFGNLLLSRLPVREVWRHALPQPADAQHADMPRCALEAVLEPAPGAALRVTTTHLAYYSTAQRLAQVDALRALHRQAAAHGTPPARPDASGGPFHWRARPHAAIVCGDFNCEPGSPAHRRMLDPFDPPAAAQRLHDAWTLAHGAAPHAPTVGVHDRAQWPRAFACDFCFVSADLAPRVVALEVDARTDASDHQPLLLTLQ